MKRISILTICLLTATGSVRAQTGLSARSLGMAGAYQNQASGAEVTRWNPANLGLAENSGWTLDLMGVALSLGNNSVSLSLYNRYFSQSYFDQNGAWDDAAKNNILSAIPSSGFAGYNRLQLTVLGLAHERFAFAVNSFLYSGVRLPVELFAIPLQGLGTDPVRLDDVGGQVMAGTELAFSAAQPFDLGWDRVQAFSAGATVKLLIGHAYAEVLEAGGYLLSNEDSIAVNGDYRLLTAGLLADGGGMGLGWSLDLGAAAQMSDRVSLGLGLSNPISRLGFSAAQESRGSIAFNQPGLNADEFDNFESYLDSVTATEDTSWSQAGAAVSLPAALTLSGSYRWSSWAVVEADFQQGLNGVAGGSTTPRLALGAELRKYAFLPVRFGIALGGVQGSTMAFGVGLDLHRYQLDLALANQQGLFNHSKGIHLALSQRILLD